MQLNSVRQTNTIRTDWRWCYVVVLHRHLGRYRDQLLLMLHRHQYHHAQSCQSRARPSQLQVQSWRRPSWSTEPPVHSGTPDNIRRARQRSSVLRWNHALLVSRGATDIVYCQQNLFRWHNAIGLVDVTRFSISYPTTQLTEWFSVGRGTRQGCNISPTEFNLYAERIMRKVDEAVSYTHLTLPTNREV